MITNVLPPFFMVHSVYVTQHVVHFLLVTKCYNLEYGTLYIYVELLTLPVISADVPLKLFPLTLDLLVGVKTSRLNY